MVKSRVNIVAIFVSETIRNPSTERMWGQKRAITTRGACLHTELGGGVRGSLMETKVSPGTMARKLQSK